MRLLYFASVRQTIGISGEDVALPAGVGDAAGLVAWLQARGGVYADALGDTSRLRIAVNQVHADGATPVTDDDEVALFPPMTGG